MDVQTLQDEFKKFYLFCKKPSEHLPDTKIAERLRVSAATLERYRKDGMEDASTYLLGKYVDLKSRYPFHPWLETNSTEELNLPPDEPAENLQSDPMAQVLEFARVDDAWLGLQQLFHEQLYRAVVVMGKSLFKSSATKDSLPNNTVKSIFLDKMSVAASKSGNYKDACSYHRQAIRLVKEGGKFKTVYQTNLAMIMMDWERYTRARTIIDALYKKGHQHNSLIYNGLLCAAALDGPEIQEQWEMRFRKLKESDRQFIIEKLKTDPDPLAEKALNMLNLKITV